MLGNLDQRHFSKASSAEIFRAMDQWGTREVFHAECREHADWHTLSRYRKVAKDIGLRTKRLQAR